MDAACVYAIATMDTKGQELAYLAKCLAKAGVRVKTVDVGCQGLPTAEPDIPREQILSGQDLSAEDRGAAVTKMGDSLSEFLARQSGVAGVIGIGGSGGTALITAAMRQLPIGLPKLMVSTVASGNVQPYVDCSDITMMYSVVDVAGLNRVSSIVLANAAHAMAGMVSQSESVAPSSRAIGLTMFGVTTPCVDRVRQNLESEDLDCLVFHATGTGGRAMEKLVESGMISAVLDLTTTEVADEIVGGVFPAGRDRFDRMIHSAIPLVVSVGAVDMVNFGARDSIPSKFHDRRFHVHNEQVTLMRTNAEENRAIAEFITGKLNQSSATVRLVVPERGVSMLDGPGKPFFDPTANEVLFDTLQQTFVESTTRKLIRLPHHINDPEFADAAISLYREICL